MKTLNALLLSALAMTPVASLAQDTARSEQAVVELIKTYWDARNNADHNTVAAMESQSGFLGTNSDGSFHKPPAVASAADWQRNMATNGGNLRVAYPEAYEVADGVVYARYYAEGVVGTQGNMSPYRTRVTSVWVEEDGVWRVKSMHFSPANFGGVHKTQSADFDD